MRYTYEDPEELDLQLTSEPPKGLIRRDSEARRSIDSMVDLALKRGNAANIGDLIDQVAALRQYRLFNALLAVLQRPRACMLLSQEKWETQWRRTVRRNEHPIVLLVPGGPVMFLFDVSQTQGREDSRPLPLPHENPFAMNDVADAAVALARLIEGTRSDGVRAMNAREGWRRAGCIQRAQSAGSQVVPSRGPRTPARSVPVRWELMINDALSATEQLATLAHELGHLYCGHIGAERDDKWPDRRDLDHESEEFEAESVARLVLRRIAPEVEFPPYRAGLLDRDMPLRVGWSHVVHASELIIEFTKP